MIGLMTLAITACGEDMVKEAAGIKDKENTEEETHVIVSGPAVKLEEYDITKIVTLPDYSKLKIDNNITDKDIEAEKKELLENNPIRTVLDEGIVKEGDVVNIDYKGTIDGEEFDGGTASDYELQIGSGTMIPGFEDDIIGISVGETKEIECYFPSDYEDKNIAGKKAKFQVKVNSIIDIKKATFNDEFVKNYTSYKSIDDYNNRRKKDLIDQAENEAPIEMLQKIMESSTITDMPKTLLQAERGNMKSEAQAMMDEQNMTFEELAKSNGQTKEQLNSVIEMNAQEMAKTMLVIEAILAKENKEVTDEDIDRYINQAAVDTEQTTAQVEQKYNNYYHQSLEFREYMKRSVQYDTVINIIKKIGEKNNKKKGETK